VRNMGVLGGTRCPVDICLVRTGAEAKKLESSSPAGLDLSKKGHLNDVLFDERERETGLEPAAPTLARSCSTN
jgi:hypothetical protein